VHGPSASDEILIAGLGSVGRRHLRNLRALGWTNVRLFRTRRATLPDDELDGLPVDTDLDAALRRRPLAVIVANPSALHLEVAIAAARAGAHVLVEKPLSHSLDRVQLLEHEICARNLVALVGFQFRFNPGLRQLKAWIDESAIGEVISANVHWGEYLPGMHPWEDYRRGYAARRDLGGGALLTFCHAFDYLRWMLGEVTQVAAAGTDVPQLGVDVDTCVDVLLRFARGASAHVHLDLVQQPHEHRLTVIGTNGTLAWSHDDHAARRYCPSSGSWVVVPPPESFERNTMFMSEMAHFLACLRGQARPSCTLRDGREAVRIVEEARRAMRRACA
jgi:predicted dehydrogenase